MSKTLIGLLDHFSVKFLYAKIHLITKFILVILSFLLYYYIFSTYVSPVNIDYCCQGSVACIFVYFSFLYNIVIIEKKNCLKELNFFLQQFFKFSQNIYTSFSLFYISKSYKFLNFKIVLLPFGR